MADLLAAGAACDNAVTQGTNKEQISSWKRWLEYLTSIGLGDDIFLDKLSRSQRHRLLGAFIQAIRDARFSAERFPSVEPSWTMWQRPSGLTTGLTPDMTATVDWRTFYNAN
jgi:hypothetical protein